MAIDWIPRAPKSQKRDHSFGDERYLGTEPPCTMYERKPLIDPDGKKVDGLYVAWITLNNPTQFNSYTGEMVKGVAVAFDKAVNDDSVVAVVFTGAGDKAFCTGGNVTEYTEYYARRPLDCHAYVSPYWHLFESCWNSPKPFIRRANGISIGGGEEMGGCCDFTIASDLATFGQVGPLHGSTAMGGACQFKAVEMTIQDALWNSMSCEQWSAYKMYRKNYIHQLLPVLKKDGQFIRNPMVQTDTYVENGEIVYGEFKTGKAFEEGKKLADSLPRDLSLLDKACMDMAWKIANLYPGCVGLSLGIIRTVKREVFDRTRSELSWWFAANAGPYGEYDMGMSSFYTRKKTGKDNADVLKYRRMLAEGHPVDEEMFEAVMPKLKK
jgi:6-oxocyclohex-1-ene-carbonyl-CoA hydrolase